MKRQSTAYKPNLQPSPMKNHTWRVAKSFATAALLILPGASILRADYTSTLQSFKPLGYWRLEETVKVPADTAINSGTAGDLGTGFYLLDGTPASSHGAPGALTSGGNKAAAFAGGQYVVVPSTPAINPSGSFTVEAWIQPAADPAGLTSPLSYAQAGDPRTGWFLYQNNVAGQGWDFRMFKNDHLSRALDISGGDVPVTGTWYHVSISYDTVANLASLYVNGVKVASGNPVGYVPNALGPFSIGARSDGAFGYTGSVDEVALYDKVLPDAVILSHYQNGTSSSPAQAYDALIKSQNPLLYYRLDEPDFVAPATLPVANNSGSWGATGNGGYDSGTTPGQVGVLGGGFSATNKAVGLNGLAGSVVIPAGQSLSTDTVTYTAWVKPNGLQSGWNAFLFQRGVNGGTAKATGFGFGDQNDLRVHWEDTEYDWVAGLPIPSDTWSFVAAVLTPTNTTLCVNGQFATHAATHAAHDFSTDPINLGLDPTGGRVLKGELDEVAIFDKALTKDQLLQLFGAGKVSPAITQQPVGPASSVFEGSSVTLSVGAVGFAPLTYQWQKDAKNITGATNASLALANLTVTNSGAYDVVVANGFGSITSSIVALTVKAGPPLITTAPVSVSRYLGGMATFGVTAGGSRPLTYTWLHGTNVAAGETNFFLSISQLGAADAGDYSVIVTNPYGTTTNTATLTLVTPTSTYEQAVVGLGAVDYWRFSETNGATFADLVAGFDGKLNATVKTGVAGPRPSGDAGFEGTNTGVQFDGKTSDLTAPPIGLGLNTVTITAWFNPAVVQADNAGLVYSRGLGTVAGIDFNPGGDLGYNWNDNKDAYNWKSGLTPTTNVWNFVALVIEPTQATMYLDAGSGLQSAVNSGVPHLPEGFADILHFGTDPLGNRLFEGVLDEVAIFDHSLTGAEVQALRDAGVTGVSKTFAASITADPVGGEILENSKFTLTSGAVGSQPLAYQWQKNGADIPGAVRASYTLSSAKVSDSGTYHLVVSQGATKVTSKDAVLVVHPTPTSLNATNGLVLHLTFDTGYSDTSGHNNNGTPVGGPQITAGKIGAGALHYSTTLDSSKNIATASYVDLGSPADLAIGPGNDFSVAFWVRFTGEPGDLPFLGNTINSYSDTGIDFAPSYNQGAWSWSLKDITTSESSVGLYAPVQNSINDGAWHSLVHVFNRKASAVTYLDGVIVDSTDISGIQAWDFNIPNQAWEIGQAGGGTYKEPGEFDLDDLGFWRRALTQYEAQSIYIVGSTYGKSFDVPGGTTTPVTLGIQSNGTSVTLSWTGGTLESSTAINGTWTAVSGATGPTYTVTPSAGGAQVFYRVRGN